MLYTGGVFLRNWQQLSEWPAEAVQSRVRQGCIFSQILSFPVIFYVFGAELVGGHVGFQWATSSSFNSSTTGQVLCQFHWSHRTLLSPLKGRISRLSNSTYAGSVVFVDGGTELDIAGRVNSVTSFVVVVYKIWKWNRLNTNIKFPSVLFYRSSTTIINIVTGNL